MDLFFHISLLTLSAIVISTIILFFLHRNPKAPHSPTTILKPYPILGNLPHFFNNHHRLLDWVTELLTASPTGTVTVAPFVFTADPAVVEHITVTRFATYQKGHTIENLHDLLGQGIFNSDGDTWQLQRKTASFEFNTSGLRSFLHDAIHRELDTRLIPILARSARTGSVVELHDVLKRFAFDNICSLGFGIDLAVLGGAATEDSEQFYRAFEDAVNLSIYRWSYHFHWSWKLRRWLNTGFEHKLRASLAAVRGSIETLMQRTRASARLDLVSRFAASGALSDDAICDSMISFLIAGRDTMPSSLTWFFWEISSKPHVTERILDEIKSMRSNSGEGGGSNSGEGGGLNLDQLKRMQYLHAALTESMRLHPPVPLQDRECMEDDVLPDGTEVRKGWTVKFSSYVMGRSERLWGKGWADFRPERWMEEGVFKAGSPFKYPVFNAGPRVCLGREMAYIQMKAVAAAVLERFDMEVAEERGKKLVLMTMGMLGGLPVRVKERKPLEQVITDD